MDQKCALKTKTVCFWKTRKKSSLEEGNDVPKQSQKAALFPILPVNSYEKLCYFLIFIFCNYPPHSFLSHVSVSASMIDGGHRYSVLSLKQTKGFVSVDYFCFLNHGF